MNAKMEWGDESNLRKQAHPRAMRAAERKREHEEGAKGTPATYNADKCCCHPVYYYGHVEQRRRRSHG